MTANSIDPNATLADEDQRHPTHEVQKRDPQASTDAPQQNKEGYDEHSDLMNEGEIKAPKTDNEEAGRPPLSTVGEQLVLAFNHSPYLLLNGMQMRFDGETIRCYLDAREDLIGNVTFGILHGGVAATMLDSIGGIVAMLEIYRSNRGSTSDQFKKISRLATVDLRVDYIAPGRGKQFVASAEVLRMGRKGATVRMQMVNDEDKLIATGVASFAY